MNALIVLSIFVLSAAAFADTNRFVAEERIYRGFQAALKTQKSLELPSRSVEERKLAFDAIEDGLLAPDAWIPESELPKLTAPERVRWLRLKSQYGRADKKLEERILSEIPAGELDEALALEVFQGEGVFVSEAAKGFAKRTSITWPKVASEFRAAGLPPLSAAVARDLFNQKPSDLAGHDGGRFLNVPRLFMFCRADRHHPCLFALRDRNDQPVRVNGKLWTQPSLGLSWDDRPYNKRGGHTPQGVYHIEGVMPDTDDQEGFGKFRRMILDFVKKSKDEAEQKKLLPASVQEFSWWKEAVTARNIGRNLLRIHGTGQKSDEGEPYFPLVPTAGCIAQREMEYEGVNYTDQRKILDMMMRSAGMEAKYENEPAIRALLYVVNVDDTAAPMSAEDLSKYGIR